MKYKSIILILSIFILFSIASVSAGEVDDKVMMSDENAEIESTSIEKDLKTTDDNQVLSKTNDDEIQSVKDNEITIYNFSTTIYNINKIPAPAWVKISICNG